MREAASSIRNWRLHVSVFWDFGRKVPGNQGKCSAGAPFGGSGPRINLQRGEERGGQRLLAAHGALGGIEGRLLFFAVAMQEQGRRRAADGLEEIHILSIVERVHQSAQRGPRWSLCQRLRCLPA
ncbi:MAG TPA: hypothetical protein VFO11_06955, partial [Candidatus Polarisedimenticolaceae bacterium]|nr:hypothetical protein [Candidatus Polarisedimenticolaceae bacterium]